MRDDRPMRRLAPIIDRLAVGAVLALAIFVLAKAHRSVDYWTVAWPGVLTGCGTLALAAVTYRVLVGDQEDRRKRDLHDQKQAEQDRRAQAEAISGWYAGEEDTYSDAHPDASPPTKMFILNQRDAAQDGRGVGRRDRRSALRKGLRQSPAGKVAGRYRQWLGRLRRQARRRSGLHRQVRSALDSSS
jgi:hypothetical protein